MQVWVIDTSSVIELRQIPRPDRQPVLDALTALVDGDAMYFPPQVLGELDRHSDVAHRWAKANATKGCRLGHLYPEGAQILGRLPNLIDHTKIGVDQADPYVVATAQVLAKQNHQVTVITDDVRTRPTRTSLSAAAGAFGFPAVPMSIFLHTQGIYIQP